MHAHCTVPSKSPVIVSVAVVTATSLRLSWDPPAMNTQNGLITSYGVSLTVSNLSCKGDWTLQSSNNTKTLMVHNVTYYILTGLMPATNYILAVSAATSVGSGPNSESVCVTTPTTTPGTHKYSSYRNTGL